MERQMVRISVQVRSGTARFRVGVRAGSITNALAMVGGMYPRGEVRVVFPAELEGFLAEKPLAPAGVAGRAHAVAA